MMDHYVRYGLEFNPFVKNSEEIIVDTLSHREGIYRLNYLSDTKGFGLLTGSPGKGKTTMLRAWASTLNASLFKVVYSSRSTLTVQDFYRHLAQELGADPMLDISRISPSLMIRFSIT
ncbi:MAG: AAA family ATPase [Lachnospiraceae bacterium]